MGMGIFSILGAALGTAIGGPGFGTAIGAGLGGLVDSRDASSGQRRNSQQQRLDAARGYVPGGGGQLQQALNPGIGQFLRLARAAAPTQGEFQASAAMRGVGRDAAGRLGALQGQQAGLEAGSNALDAYNAFQRQKLGALVGMRGQDIGVSEARKDRRGSFLNNILGIGTGLIGTNLGEGRGPFDFGGGGSPIVAGEWNQPDNFDFPQQGIGSFGSGRYTDDYDFIR